MAKDRRGSRGAPDTASGKTKMDFRKPGSGKAGARVDTRVQREIGRHLRAHYDQVVSEPLPDKFLDLLEQLERTVTRKD